MAGGVIYLYSTCIAHTKWQVQPHKEATVDQTNDLDWLTGISIIFNSDLFAKETLNSEEPQNEGLQKI